MKRLPCPPPTQFLQTKNVSRAVDNSSPLETACSLRSRPRVQVRLEPFHADVAIIVAAFSMGFCPHFDYAI